MIAYIKGTLTEIYEDSIVLEQGGIGYDIQIPGSVFDVLPPCGSEMKVHTYFYVREDIVSLYGFLTRDDLNIFRLLLTVSGIGPKGALGILSAITPDNLRFAILSEDSKTIAKAPGIGAKTAKRLIIELKDKLNLSEALEISKEHAVQAGDALDGNIRTEAVEALTALGYSGAEALRAVKQVEITDDMTVEELLKASLKKIQ